MASIIIHICIAKKLNENLKLNENKFLTGAIAPDITKITGTSKNYTHFIEENNTSFNNNINIDKFISKYKSNIKDDFILGYYIHLYTDYLWYNFYIKNFINSSEISLLDGKIIENNNENYQKYIYNDYDILDPELIKKYNLDLTMLNDKLDNFNNIIEEIPYNKIPEFINYVKKIPHNNKNNDLKVFKLNSIIQFIEEASSEIYQKVISILKEV